MKKRVIINLNVKDFRNNFTKKYKEIKENEIIVVERLRKPVLIVMKYDKNFLEERNISPSVTRKG